MGYNPTMGQKVIAPPPLRPGHGFGQNRARFIPQKVAAASIGRMG